MKYDRSTEGTRNPKASAANRVTVAQKCPRCGGEVSRTPANAQIKSMRGKWFCETCGAELIE